MGPSADGMDELGMVVGVMHRLGLMDVRSAVAMACTCRALAKSTDLVEEVVLEAQRAERIWGRAGGWDAVLSTFPSLRAVTLVGGASSFVESDRALWAGNVVGTCLRRLPQLTRLRIESAGLDDDAAQALAATLERHGESSLLSLELPGNRIRDAGAVALVVAAAGVPSLQRLDLAENLVGRDGCKAIEEALSLEGFSDRLDVVLVGQSGGGRGEGSGGVGVFEALGMVVDAAIVFVAETVGSLVEAIREGIQDANREALLEGSNAAREQTSDESSDETPAAEASRGV